MADTYKIDSQNPRTEINPAGNNFIPVWDIHYTVTSGAAKGTSGIATVPEADHNAKHVDTVIREKVAHLSEIAALGK